MLGSIAILAALGGAAIAGGTYLLVSDVGASRAAGGTYDGLVDYATGAIVALFLVKVATVTRRA